MDVKKDKNSKCARDPCLLFSDELSRRDKKGLKNQDGEVLIPINKQNSDIASGTNVSENDLVDGAGDPNSMLGYACRIVDGCGPDA